MNRAVIQSMQDLNNHPTTSVTVDRQATLRVSTRLLLGSDFWPPTVTRILLSAACTLTRCTGQLTLLILIAILFLTGCNTPFQRFESARDLFAAGNLVDARQSLLKVQEDHPRYKTPAELDLAMVDLAEGNPVAAEKRLRKLRDGFEAAPKIDAMGEITSLATDDTALRYQPAGYEEVLIRSMLAVCSLANDQIDAESYTLQAMAKQAALANESEKRGLLNAKDIYQPIAFAPYLRGVLREATHHDYDDATRAYTIVSEVQPSFDPVLSDIQRVSFGSHSQPKHGVIYVIACTGRGPILQETVAPTTTAAMQIASLMLNSAESESIDENGNPTQDRLILPNLAPVKVPEILMTESNVARIGVTVDGRPVGATETLTDVETLARTQLDAEMPWTIARAVVRRATKEIAVAKTSDALGMEGNSASIFRFAASTIWSGTESADTRCWSLLPREIQVLRIEVPEGEHALELSTLGWSDEVHQTSKKMKMDVIDGKNHYVIAIAPDEQLYTIASDDISQSPTSAEL